MILVTGAKGQLGGDVCNELKKRAIPHLGTDIDTLDLTDKKAVASFFEEKKPSAVIHCAAYTAVDKAEDEKELCFKVNEKATKNLAEECKKSKIKILYVSTDYVFPGNGTSPFESGSKTAPLNTYGLSKLKGEEAVKDNCEKYFIVRTSWVFGEKNTNFIATMLKIGANRESVKVVNDQIGSPTYSKDLAVLLCDMIVTEKYGTYHGTNEGYCSWYELCKKAYEINAMEAKIIPVSSAEFPTKATRPLNSRLSKASLDKAGFKRLPTWEDAVERYLSK